MSKESSMGCVFCKIIAGQLASHKVYEDDFVIVIAPLKEHIIARGHMIMIPKNHCADIFDISNKDLQNLADSIKKISKMLKQRCKVEGMNLLHASGKAAQQSCFHFHVHLIPRYAKDGIDTWPKTNYKENNFPKIYEDLAKLCKR